MNGWGADKKWSDQYLPPIKRILGEHLIGEPPQVEDQQRNTDLIVLKMDAVRIGCRIRRAYQTEHAPQYVTEFTIRTVRPSGMRTELAKIIEGWGDYFFYGFGNEAGHVVPWALCDLRVFRLWHSSELVRRRGQQPGREMRNRDGSSNFRVFKYDDLPPGFVLASFGIRKQEVA